MRQDPKKVKLNPNVVERAVHPSLPELLRPNFFAGQLLTSEDLTALSDWVAQRLSLTRRGDGWGILCGLNVVAAPQNPADPNSLTTVLIDPGHAIDPTGRDIVVRQKQSIDLAEFCRERGCEESTTDDCRDTTQQPDAPFRLGGLSLPVNTMRSVDLWLHYAKKDREPRAVFPRPRREGRQTCEASRHEESFEFYATVSTLDQERANSAERTTTSESRDSRLDLLREFAYEFPKLWTWMLPPTNSQPLPELETWQDVERWLTAKLQSNTTFPFLQQLLGKRGVKALPWKVAEVLLWLIQGMGKHTTPCGGCPDTKSGVPLARVWLFTTSTECRVLVVDVGGGQRRPFAPPFVANGGIVDLTTLYGRLWPSVRATLGFLGYPVSGEAVRLPASPQGLARVFRPEHSRTSSHPTNGLVALVSKFPNWQDQVLGFYSNGGGSSDGDPHFELQDVVALPPTTADPAPNRERLSELPPDTFLDSRTIPLGGKLRLALKLLVPPNGFENWQVYLYESLSRKFWPFATTAASTNTDKLFLITPVIDAVYRERDSEFTLIAAKREDRHYCVASSLTKPWPVQPVGLETNLDFDPEPHRNHAYAPGEKLPTRLRMTNSSPYRITGKYRIKVGNTVLLEPTIFHLEAGLSQDNPEIVNLGLEVPQDVEGTSWTATIEFLDFTNDFEAKVASFGSVDIAISILRIKVELVRGNPSVLRLKDINEAGVQLVRYEYTDESNVTQPVTVGTLLTAGTAQEFVMPTQPAPIPGIQVVFNRAGITLVKTVLEVPSPE
ncbi:MAG: hypothetical protein ACFCD0_11830 [Gemmataceae bacterium]